VQIARPLVGLSELATQHVMPPRRFLVLTEQGLVTLAKTRPIDQLYDALHAQLRQAQPQPHTLPQAAASARDGVQVRHIPFSLPTSVY
jgi:hypothetical protein